MSLLLRMAAGAQSPWNEATGGTITTYTSGGATYRVHTFTTAESGTNFVVRRALKPFDVLLVAGGGGSGKGVNESGSASGNSGGGGGGGVLQYSDQAITAGTYAVTVGAGGAGGTYGNGASGGNSTFNGWTAIGGGYGGSSRDSVYGGGSGGSGGGSGSEPSGSGRAGGSGTAGPPRQGYNGGTSTQFNSSGGGGAGGAGGTTPNGWETDPGPGVTTTITGSTITVSPGGVGYASSTHGPSTPLLASYGKGGDGVNGQDGIAGQGGVVIIRYRIA